VFGKKKQQIFLGFLLFTVMQIKAETLPWKVNRKLNDI